MAHPSITKRLRERFIEPPKQHSISDFVGFTLIGGTHLIAGTLIYGELPVLVGLVEPTNFQVFARSFWWIAFAAGISWIAVPFLIRFGGPPMPRLLSLVLHIAALGSGFAMLPLAFAAAGAGG